jgi:hypothetical protein
VFLIMSSEPRHRQDDSMIFVTLLGEMRHLRHLVMTILGHHRNE